jgi:hypothetical protein
MKYVLCLALVVAAAAGATREITAGRSGALATDAAHREPGRATVPWLTEAWSSSVERASMDEGGEDPHAGLYATGEYDPHAGLYATDEEDPHAGLHATDEDTSGMCPRPDDSDEAVGAELIPADTDPHAAPLGRAALLQAGFEPRAVTASEAANGHTIAQIHARRAALAEHVVRVRGTVTKRTDGILGKTYLHLWDGSATPETGEDDLTVTTTDEFEIGETVELEGRLLVDQDLGLGYRYSALLDGATRISVR